MVEVDDADSASLAAALPPPPDLANATACRDQIAGLGVARYEIDELEALVGGALILVVPAPRATPSYRRKPVNSGKRVYFVRRGSDSP